MESMSDTVILSSKTSMAPSFSIRSVTVFRDDFNHFDKSHYRIEVDATGGGNGEFQIYTPEHQNLYTANGYLYIKPWNAKAMSNGVNHGITQITSALHWGTDRAHKRSNHNERQSNGGDWHSWHTYSLEWTAQHIICPVDNHEILRVNTPSNGFWEAGNFSGTNIWGDNKNAPFDQPFRVLLNVAVAGLGFFSDRYQYDTPKPWRNDSPHPKRDFWEKRNVWLPTWQGDYVAMLIDYIEMIQY
ncbi:beta-1,3-glucan-binding protein-like [Saccostrea cucullata]|uniref:beta-1,3-glucan-binding protein-like n=1 Tax=Saccostrea cuccullata TaxID=36930 RepID=UPI002ED168B3